jgi:methionyl aminopeptidase
VTTAELDALAGRVFARYGARSAPKLVYGAPCEVFISVNDQAVHGVPGRRTIRTADGAPAAHVEHTIVVSAGRPLVLTA